MFRQNAEKKAFAQRFADKTEHIVALTGANGVGGGRSQGETYWTAGIDLAAWKDEQGLLHAETRRLVTLADDAELGALRKQLQPDQIVRLTVRPEKNGSRYLLAGRIAAAEDSELAALLAERLQIVTYTDDILGTFTLDRQVDWFAAEVLWCGQSVQFVFDQADADSMAQAVQTGRRLWQDEVKWDQAARAFAAEELLALKNETWLDDDEEEVTADAFSQRLSLESVTLETEGGFVLWFDDGDLFWGHTICVYGRIEEGFTQATIEG